MEERKEGQDETLLPTHEHELTRLNPDGSGYGSEDESDGGYSDYGDKPELRKSIKGSLWIVLATTATLTGRGLLRGDFPYPLYLLFSLQIATYALVAITVLVVQVHKLRQPKAKIDEDGYTMRERVIVGVRLLVSACFSAVAIICAAEALMLYNNLTVLAMLPILTYVSDSMVFRLLHLLRITRQDGVTMPLWTLWIVILIPLCLTLVVFEDYRLNTAGLWFALASFFLFSLAKAVMRIGPKIEKSARTWDSPLKLYLVAGIPFLLVTWKAVITHENMVAASHVMGSWSNIRYLWNVVPSILLQLLFTTSMNSAYPYSSNDQACGALEDPHPDASTAVRATLHTSFFTSLFGAIFGKERNLMDWLQVISFIIIYIASVGPRHIAFYPPRFVNMLTRIARRKQTPIQAQPWQLPLVLIGTTLVFAILMSCNAIFLIDTFAYNRDAQTWFVDPTVNLDKIWRPPAVRSMDIIIAHSAGDPQEQIAELITRYTSLGSVANFGPSVIIYSKDPTLDLANVGHLRGPTFEGPISVATLSNSGGPTASYLYHIITNWDKLSQQTLFITTTPSTPPINPDHLHQRLSDYFIYGSFPMPDASDKTSFLNLGPMEVCNCGSCKDSTGWEDSFKLLPSMYGGANPGLDRCGSVLLTRGNHFVASAARLRGIKKDIYEMLRDALEKADVKNSWAHEADRLPKPLPFEPLIGRWFPGTREEVPSGGVLRNETKGEVKVVEIPPGVYGKSDTLERPWLGMTVERLWGVLLQCSSEAIAWRCPGLGTGWRLGGQKGDCGCID
ncbi:hypothetical protein HYALB_00008133 [Hymenoscyphus albidus]|uniref:Uncharacterized protein n=1 Tax=Hymenoscyphus albidus TaxID=595503 RepID=A0A9N9LDJ4_9HELO|nr:hypothetical protein HYALB_00008133 [Hymenoscyphus albidus]